MFTGYFCTSEQLVAEKSGLVCLYLLRRIEGSQIAHFVSDLQLGITVDFQTEALHIMDFMIKLKKSPGPPTLTWLLTCTLDSP